MLIGGIMAPAVLCLTAWDREAAPWAAIAWGGWLVGMAAHYTLGELAPYSWPFISLAQLLAMAFFFRLSPSPWKSAVSAIALMMLGLDVWLFANDYFGVYVGEEYASASTACLFVMLLIIGHRGVLNAWSCLLDWCARRLFRLSDPLGAPRKEAT